MHTIVILSDTLKVDKKNKKLIKETKKMFPECKIEIRLKDPLDKYLYAETNPEEIKLNLNKRKQFIKDKSLWDKS